MEMENITMKMDDGTTEMDTSSSLMYEPYESTSFAYNGSYYYYEDEPILLKVFPFEIVALGIVRPILVMLTTAANIFVVVYFMAKKNRGKATNLLFVSIAFSDTMTGLLLLPNSYHVYMNKNDSLTNVWCSVYMLLRLYFSPVFHTVSIWQTLILGFQRYTCVCHPFISGRICTIRKTFVSIVLAYCVAFMLHLYHVIDNKLNEVPPKCTWTVETPCTGMCVYLWFCVALQNLLPCIILVYLTRWTLKGLSKANRRLSTMSQNSLYKRSSRDRVITVTSTLIVIVFLIPELPHGIYSLILAISAHGYGIQRSMFSHHVILCIYEMVLIISFHANFWIYCSMMKEFRQSMVDLICRSASGPKQRIRSYSDSMASRKGSSSGMFLSQKTSANKNRVLSQSTSLYSNVSDSVVGNAPIPSTNSNVTKIKEHRVSVLANEDTLNDEVFL